MDTPVAASSQKYYNATTNVVVLGALNVEKHLCLEYNEGLSYTKRLCGLPCDASFVIVWQKLTNRSIFFPSEDGILSC